MESNAFCRKLKKVIIFTACIFKQKELRFSNETENASSSFLGMLKTTNLLRAVQTWIRNFLIWIDDMVKRQFGILIFFSETQKIFSASAKRDIKRHV